MLKYLMFSKLYEVYFAKNNIFLKQSKVTVLLLILFSYEIYCYKNYVLITPFRLAHRDKVNKTKVLFRSRL
jgi:hypothetical protein